MSEAAQKWIFRIMSYMGAFVLGGYLNETNHGGNIEIYQWALTGSFFIFFILMSTAKGGKD